MAQFSGGEPTIHPDLMDMIQAAKDRGIRQVMVNTSGVRIARDGRFLDDLAEQNPVINFQFDGLRPETYLTIRGEDLLELKPKTLDWLANKGIDAVLVAAIERGVNTDEVGAILKFGLEHPAVRGVVFRPVTHVCRHIEFDPMERVTIPDVIHGIVELGLGLKLVCPHPFAWYMIEEQDGIVSLFIETGGPRQTSTTRFFETEPSMRR